MVALSECGNKVNGRKIERTLASIVQQWIKGCRWLYLMPWYDYVYNAGTESVNFLCSDYFWDSAASFENILMRDDVNGFISLNYKGI